MARLWSSGFELQSAASGVEWDTTTGSPAISTTIKRSGAAALRCNTTAAAAYLSHQIAASAAATAHVYMRAYVYVATLPSAKTMLLAWVDDTNFGYGVRLHPDGKLRIEASNDFAFSSYSASSLATGTWHRIEIDYNDSTDVCTAYVNGTQVATLSSADTFGGDRFLVGSFDAVTTDLYFDDLAINDSTGTAQNGLPGAGSIVHMQPDAAGDNTQWQSSASTTTGTATVSAINEVTPDDVTTYNRRTTTTTKIDDWNLESSSSAGIGASDTITLVEHGGRYGSTSTTATARTVVKRIKGQAAGTTTSSASTAINVNGWTTHKAAVPRISNLIAYVNPQTSTAWTPSTLDTMQIGVQADVSSTNEIRYSTLWALVEYVPSASEVHTTSGTAPATASASGVSSTVRTTARTANALAGASGTSTTVRTTARSAVALAGARGTSSTVRTTARSAAATATATGVSSAVRTTARTANATATARGAETTVRTTAGTARATATATYTSTTTVTTAGTANATATARGISSTVRTTAKSAIATVSARGTSTTARTTARSANATATARGTSYGVRSTAGVASALADARGVEYTMRITSGTAAATATARGMSVVEISAIKVLVDGAYVSATPKVRQAGVWLVATPKRREAKTWVAY